MEPRYDRNRSRVADVHAHLLLCEGSFSPPLGDRVSIDDYAAKLVARAGRFEAWAGSDLIGLVAIYCNAPDRQDAFVTNVSVVPHRVREGIGLRLLGDATTYVRSLAFRRLVLSVDRSAGALGLYHRSGFQAEASDGETMRMVLGLSKDAAS
ncbi:GNAT family N-acetyltransferase [Methylobacterium planeticum]|nr:GNAT family N-acetyltransferase [Methylobacterium planeticum]